MQAVQRGIIIIKYVICFLFATIISTVASPLTAPIRLYFLNSYLEFLVYVETLLIDVKIFFKP